MRDIKFRGKRVDNGEWVYGYYVKISVKKTKHFIYTGYAETDCDEIFPDKVEVITETVGQFTGLTDKNGNEIYEGDILTTDIKRPYLIVEYRDGSFMFNCNDGGEDYYDIMLPIMKEPQTQYKYGVIIGNIHDTPELLKVGDAE